MTRRSEKQETIAVYAPARDGDEIWLVQEWDGESIETLGMFTTKQTAEQYASWYQKFSGAVLPPNVRSMRLSSKMKRID